jgi:prepilin-type N-terminal cleavage/methylation domain-containing protein
MFVAKNKGFSLVELLSVIAIVGILVAIILPMFHRASDAALRAKTKTQLSQYALALERYRQTYGAFPAFLNKTEPVCIQGIEAENLMTALSTQKLIAGSSAKQLQWNPQAISFYQFSENELSRADGKVVGIVDAHGEASICILVDKEDRGFLKEGVPQALLNAIAEPPSQEIVASILIFSQPAAGGPSVYFYE